ncbi:hypothetical protein K7X08_019827 [Anisodus acutangulus]|uniref:Ubiquitin-like protease family profile domain-containing protein n=1 Tax=Anisodus acutangulus TaxID=402998 RepID=A0A9Q1MTA0_9SOLA|nr:hypothetical protein K7X08_019827 [Anisodus acutangulus]
MSSLLLKKIQLLSILLGHFMRCNVSWCSVDDVFFPINLAEKWHWLLGRFSFKDGCVYVYDSMSGARQNVAVKKTIEAYSELIPHFLSRIDFWGSRSDGLPAVDFFDICMVDGLPTKANTDWGVFAVAFAEYMIEGSEIPNVIKDIDAIRSRYGTLL